MLDVLTLSPTGTASPDSCSFIRVQRLRNKLAVEDEEQVTGDGYTRWRTWRESDVTRRDVSET